MNTLRGALILAATLLSIAVSLARLARQEPESKAASALSDDERAPLLAKGKAIFVEKCAKCHNERGDKELSSGKPLSERGLATEAIARAVNGRLSKGTNEERKAVTLYIASLMKGTAADTRP
jgi:mono/diheme cytochrome c family protein